MKKVVAIVGTYRRGFVIDTAVEEALRGAREAGAETEKVMLLDKHIEFCTNCRVCTQVVGSKRGDCIHQDDMNAVLDTLEGADAFILASPVNFSGVTALIKRFIERMVCYADWPWGQRIPKVRRKNSRQKVLLITSSACPGFIGRIMYRSVFSMLKVCADCLGVKSVKKLYLGLVARDAEDTLDESRKHRAYMAGQKLVR